MANGLQIRFTTKRRRGAERMSVADVRALEQTNPVNYLPKFFQQPSLRRSSSAFSVRDDGDYAQQQHLFHHRPRCRPHQLRNLKSAFIRLVYS